MEARQLRGEAFASRRLHCARGVQAHDPNSHREGYPRSQGSMMTRYTITITLALLACAPIDDTPLAETETGETGHACQETERMCDGNGRCWTAVDDWPAWAQADIPEDTQAAIEAGTIWPVDLGLDAECYGLDGADYHPCVITVDRCIDLFGRPANEIALTESTCAPVGGRWSWVGEHADGTCWGIVDDFAVMLTPFRPHAGEMWGPCPTTDAGTITLCNGEMLACVPADDGDANTCLPASCPDDGPSSSLELGWGNVCYPRCEADSDCVPGMRCSDSVADGSRMCAWPR